MARKVIPGIYKITNKRNGKVYIGQSKDILKRFRQYFWGATTSKDYSETTQSITKAIREEGIDNFDFAIIAHGELYRDVHYRTAEEIRYIEVYNSTDLKYGYNDDKGGDPGSLSARPQSFIERMNRTMPVFLYNIENQCTLLYMAGARSIAEEFNCDKAITSHAVNRYDVFAKKYFIIPARYKDRHRLLKKKLASFETINSNPKYPVRTLTKVANKKERLLKAIAYIDEVAIEFGYTND